MSKLLGVAEGKLPRQPDLELDPKRTLVDLARKSRSKDVRGDLVPPAGSFRRVGAGYNNLLESFVLSTWEPARARTRSPSLARAIDAICRACL